MSEDMISFDESIKVLNSFITNLDVFFETGVMKKEHQPFVECYTIVYKLADQKDHAAELYGFHKSTMKNHLKDACIKIGDLQGEPLLKEYIRQLDNFTIIARWLTKVFNYIDRYYLMFNQLDSTSLVSLKTFREVVFTDIKKKLVDALMDEITKYRESEEVNWDLLHKTIETFINVGYKKDVKLKMVGEIHQWTGEKNLKEYDEIFEKAFLAKTKEYYSVKCNEWLQSLNCPEFISLALEKLEMEEQIAEEHMDPKTKSKLKQTLDNVIIEQNAQNVINKERTGCKEMLKNKKLDQLSKMYTLFSRVNSTLKYILIEMEPYITSRGQVVINDEALQKDPVKFTKKLLELKKEMDEIVKNCFNDDPKFNQTRDRAFLNFMNKFAETPQYMATYCDHLFKSGIKGMSEREIEENLDAIIRLFRCLHNRDVFIKAYTKHQAQRLLNKSSMNTGAEQSMISKLKIESGFNTIQKLSRMFTDMELSKGTMEHFKKNNGGTAEFKGVDINVEVLTSGVWPEQNVHPCKLPSELSQCAQKFSLFYKDKHSGRHLTWLYNSCNAILNTLTFTKTYTITATCYQAAILCLFNQHKRMTVSQMKELSGLPETELITQLKPLCKPNMKLISKDRPKVPKFAPDEGLEINPQFKYNLVKVNFIPKISHLKKDLKKKTDIENKVEEEIKSERALVLDAMIVRIMKARKKERHTELITEVIKQVLLFKPQPQMIKQAIERLIEKEYLQRDDDDRQVYVYIP